MPTNVLHIRILIIEYSPLPHAINYATMVSNSKYDMQNSIWLFYIFLSFSLNKIPSIHITFLLSDIQETYQCINMRIFCCFPIFLRKFPRMSKCLLAYLHFIILKRIWESFVIAMHIYFYCCWHIEVGISVVIVIVTCFVALRCFVLYHEPKMSYMYNSV